MSDMKRMDLRPKLSFDLWTSSAEKTGVISESAIVV